MVRLPHRLAAASTAAGPRYVVGAARRAMAIER
jgi:hypothetical protein